MRRLPIALLAGLLPAGPAAAADAPRLMPERDVVVTFRSGGDGAQLEQRLRWSAAAKRLRVEPPAGGTFVLVDYVAHRMDVVRDADRSFLEMAAPASIPGLGTPPPGRFKQEAEDRVAGLSCTEWAMATPREPAHLCITPDGVMLRVRVGAQIVAAAAAVNYVAQDPALFRVPDGYARVEPSR